MSSQGHATSTTRGQQQKFGISHSSVCLLADVPCLDNLWDCQKDCPDDKQIMWSKKAITRSIPHYMLLAALWQSCHAWITYRSVCRVVIATKDNVTPVTISYVQPGACDEWTLTTNV